MTTSHLARVFRLLTFALLLLLPHPVHGQHLARESYPGLLTLGLGGSNVGLTFGGLLGYRLGAHELAGRAIYSFKAAAFQGNSKYLLEGGLLYGFHPLRNYRAVALRTGLAAIWYAVDPVGSAPKRTFDPVIGVPFELALTAPLGSKWGIGVTGLGNLNSRRRYAGLVLTVTFGSP